MRLKENRVFLFFLFNWKNLNWLILRSIIKNLFRKFIREHFMRRILLNFNIFLTILINFIQKNFLFYTFAIKSFLFLAFSCIIIQYLTNNIFIFFDILINCVYIISAGFILNLQLTIAFRHVLSFYILLVFFCLFVGLFCCCGKIHVLLV